MIFFSKESLIHKRTLFFLLIFLYCFAVKYSAENKLYSKHVEIGKKSPMFCNPWFFSVFNSYGTKRVSHQEKIVKKQFSVEFRE
jgi:hypothetical protein